MQNIIGKAVRPIESEAYEILRAIQAYEYTINNIVEQDHRFIKKLTRHMKGFKSFKSASATLEGIEVAHVIRKQQFETSGQSTFKKFAALAG